MNNEKMKCFCCYPEEWNYNNTKEDKNNSYKYCYNNNNYDKEDCYKKEDDKNHEKDHCKKDEWNDNKKREWDCDDDRPRERNCHRCCFCNLFRNCR